MTFHEKFAGAESVYAFLGGFPQIRTSADFAAGFRAQAEQEIERLIELLDAIDGDFDLELEPDAEPSIAQNEWTGAWEPIEDAILVCDFLGDTVPDRELDVAEMREQDLDFDEGDDSDFEPDADGEPSLGWTTNGASGGDSDLEEDQADREASLGWGNPRELQGQTPLELNPQRSLGCIDGEDDAGENAEHVNEDGGNITDEPHDNEGGVEAQFQCLDDRERAEVNAIGRRARAMRPSKRYHPDACTIIRPGVVRMGLWL